MFLSVVDWMKLLLLAKRTKRNYCYLKFLSIRRKKDILAHITVVGPASSRRTPWWNDSRGAKPSVAFPFLSKVKIVFNSFSFVLKQCEIVWEFRKQLYWLFFWRLETYRVATKSTLYFRTLYGERGWSSPEQLWHFVEKLNEFLWFFYCSRLMSLKYDPFFSPKPP